MSRRLFDFSCPKCGSITEKLVNTNIYSVKCDCGTWASRIISMPTIKLDGTSGDFPSAHDHWAKIREDRHREGRKKSYAKP